MDLSPANAPILFLTRRVYVTFLGLALMAMLVACGEASPTQTPENSLMERTPVPGVERTEALTDTYRVEVWMGPELTSMMITTAFPVMSVMDGGRPVNRHIEIHIFDKDSGTKVTDMVPTVSISNGATDVTRELAKTQVEGGSKGTSFITACQISGHRDQEPHFGDNIYLATGSYEVVVGIGTETAVFDLSL